MLFGRVLFKLLKLMGLQRSRMAGQRSNQLNYVSPLAESTIYEIACVYAALHALHIMHRLP
jgi:hypothetical protein